MKRERTRNSPNAYTIKSADGKEGNHKSEDVGNGNESKEELERDDDNEDDGLMMIGMEALESKSRSRVGECKRESSSLVRRPREGPSSRMWSIVITSRCGMAEAVSPGTKRHRRSAGEKHVLSSSSSSRASERV